MKRYRERGKEKEINWIRKEERETKRGVKGKGPKMEKGRKKYSSGIRMEKQREIRRGRIKDSWRTNNRERKRENERKRKGKKRKTGLGRN